MPTFRLYHDGYEVDTVAGCSKAGLDVSCLVFTTLQCHHEYDNRERLSSSLASPTLSFSSHSLTGPIRGCHATIGIDPLTRDTSFQQTFLPDGPDQQRCIEYEGDVVRN